MILQLLLYGDESAERLAHEITCELGYTTPDGMQVSILNSHETHALHSKVGLKNPRTSVHSFNLKKKFGRVLARLVANF
jgi:hypothetical protein